MQRALGDTILQTGILLKLISLPRRSKRAIVLTFDIMLCFASVSLAYYLRLGEWMIPYRMQWLSYGAAILFAIPLFIRFGLYRAIFRYAGWGALAAVLKACAIYAVIYSGIFFAIGFQGIPRTTGIIQPILLFIMVGGSRTIVRYLLDEGQTRFATLGKNKRVMIYGAGRSGRQIAAGLANSHEMQVVGFIDDDARLSGSSLNGKMIYSSEKIETVLEALGVSDILLAMPSASRAMRNAILNRLRGISVNVRTLPGLMDLAHGKVTVSDLRELDIDDLLGRDAVLPNRELLDKRIVGKIVMVTGAGGSIGSELCRQIIKLGPSALLLVEMNEYSLYSIHQELDQKRDAIAAFDIQVIPLLASVQDQERIERIISTWKPDTIFHAAAYKHVPLVEHNPAQGIRNNVYGTLNTAQIAARHSVSDFVLISTDKAVRPTNIMGASKRIAEMVLQAFAREQDQTRFSMVRFGNVLGSSGSVVPLFRQQIKSGGPLTVTHPDITRYFMTIPEASQLVIQASAMATGGEVFVLDMGEPVKIVDLAQRMIELSGLTLRNLDNPEGDIGIEFVGLRPGEKLYEELLIGNNPEPTEHPGIMKANEQFLPYAELMDQLSALDKILHANATIDLLDKLSELVVDYKRNPQAVDWVHLHRVGINMATLPDTPDMTAEKITEAENPG